MTDYLKNLKQNRKKIKSPKPFLQKTTNQKTGIKVKTNQIKRKNVAGVNQKKMESVFPK